MSAGCGSANTSLWCHADRRWTHRIHQRCAWPDYWSGRRVGDLQRVLLTCTIGLGEGDFVIVGGTLIPTDRIKADEPYYSQKHEKHGMNVQIIARPDGAPLWFSRATPGRTHDLTAARAHGIVQA
ncbi:hypothetical protein ABIE67_009830 [Streptomyces sp. V4I8]